MEAFLRKLGDLAAGSRLPAVAAINFAPWNAATVVGRLMEELGVDAFVFLTRWEAAGEVEESLQHVQREVEVRYLADYKVDKSLLRDNPIDNSFLFSKVLSTLEAAGKREFVVDLTMSSGELAASIWGALKSLNPSSGLRPLVTAVDSIALRGIPAYPGNPRWLHRVYVYGADQGGPGERKSIVADPPRVIEWKGTRGLYVAVSKLINSLTVGGIAEFFDGSRRRGPGGDRARVSAFAVGRVTGEKRRLLSIDPVEGPDDEAASMMYNSWKALYEAVGEGMGEGELKVLERILRQLQRLTGSADLVVGDVATQGGEAARGEKLHAFIRELREEHGGVAVVPDTNLFYQGIHMSLLKASIRDNAPWSPIPGVNIYVPACAEAEINGKIAAYSASSSGMERYAYVMALLANRVLQEVRHMYEAETLPAISQPCEASVAVEAPSLRERAVALLTADKKAFSAWQTYNVCRNNVYCVYVDHSDRPLNTGTLFSKFYASVVAANVIFAASLFVPVTVESELGSVKVAYHRLRGATAPSVVVAKAG